MDKKERNNFRPKISSSQKTGKKGEEHFAALLSKKGWIFHPNLSGNDFGIDGRVEIIPSEGPVSSLEFYVQIKSTNKTPPKNKKGYFVLGNVKISTVAYWQTKLSPTLLVLFLADKEEFYFEWIQKVIDSATFYKALNKSNKTISISIPSTNKFTLDKFALIEKEVLADHLKIGKLLNMGSMQSDFHILYRVVSESLDILLEWLVWSTIISSDYRIDKFIEPKSFLAKKHRNNLNTPKSVIPHLPAKQIYIVIELFRSFKLYLNIVAAYFPHDVENNSLITFIKDTADTIEKLYLDMYSNCEDDTKRLAKTALYEHQPNDDFICLSCPLIDAENSLGLITIVIRDFLLRTRNLVFRNIPETKPENPMQKINIISIGNVTFFDGWKE